MGLAVTAQCVTGSSDAGVRAEEQGCPAEPQQEGWAERGRGAAACCPVRDVGTPGSRGCGMGGLQGSWVGAALHVARADTLELYGCMHRCCS